MESQGRDIKMDERRVEGYRNFATKLWNAARFCQANGIGASTSIEPPPATLAVNKWIIGEVVETVRAMDAALADYRFDGAASAIYHFTWDRFCDWYLELIKPILSPASAPSSDTVRAEPVEALPLADMKNGPSTSSGQTEVAETRAVAGWVLDQILVLLHPFMPFVTEELWSKLGVRQHELIVAKWPSFDAPVDNVSINSGRYPIDHDARAQIEWLIETVSAVRAAKNEIGIAPGQRLQAYVEDSAPIVGQHVAQSGAALARLARLDVVFPDAPPPGAALRVAVPQATLVVPLEGIIDLDAERARLTKAIAAAEKERDALAGRLDNPSFVERAKPEAVEKARADHAEKAAEAERLSAALARLG